MLHSFTHFKLIYWESLLIIHLRKFCRCVFQDSHACEQVSKWQRRRSINLQKHIRYSQQGKKNQQKAHFEKKIIESLYVPANVSNWAASSNCKIMMTDIALEFTLLSRIEWRIKLPYFLVQSLPLLACEMAFVGVASIDHTILVTQGSWTAG